MLPPLLIRVTPDNLHKETLFCVKDIKSPGFAVKKQWFLDRYHEGLRLLIMKDPTGKPIAFIEYLPIEHAWRPVMGNNMLFIHCMFVYANKDKNRGLGSELLKACEEDARHNGLDGIAVMSSDGSWMAGKGLFLRNKYHQVDARGRFELLVKKLNTGSPDPFLIDWTSRHSAYTGWHLVYADQCPWHEKSVNALKGTASEYGINLQVTKISSSEEAKNAPSGTGVFSLLYNGKLLEDHYLSETRFRSILNKELRNNTM